MASSLTQEAVDAGWAGTVWGRGESPAHGFSMALGLLTIWWLSPKRLCPKHKHFKAEAAIPSLGSHTVTSITFYWFHGASLNLVWEGNP